MLRQDLDQVGHQYRTSGQDSQDWVWCRACLASDFKVMSGYDLQWVWLDCRKTRINGWSRFSARPKFEPSEDFVQVVLCSLRLLGSVVCTRFAVCFDHDHAFSLYLCCGRVWTLTGSSTFVKVILIIQGLGSAFELGCFHRPYLNGSPIWIKVDWVWIKGVPLARSDWMASCVSDCESGFVKNSLITVRGSCCERLVVYACLTFAESSCLAEG